MSSSSPVSTYYTFTNCSINNSSFHIHITNNSGSGTSTADASDIAAAADTASSSTTTAAAADVAADTTSKSNLRYPKRAAAADLIPDTHVSSLYWNRMKTFTATDYFCYLLLLSTESNSKTDEVTLVPKMGSSADLMQKQ